jgi:hypothetical protein
VLLAQLDARSRRWLSTNDPAALWPDLDVSALPAAALGIERAVARILDGRPASLGAADGADADVVGIAALLSGTGPLLGYWTEQGRLDVAPPLERLLTRHIEHGRVRISRIRREIEPALDALVRAGAAPAILKGFHTSHVYFPEPATRPLADVDVYVEPRSIARAQRALRSVGFHGGESSGRCKTDWYAPGDRGHPRSFEFWHALSPWKLELHTAVDFGTLLRHGVQLDRALAVNESWDALGLQLRVMPQPLLFVALAAHASCELKASRLIRLVELIYVIRRDSASGALDWAAAVDLIERTGATRFVYPALTLVEQLAPGTVQPALLTLARRRSTRIARGVVRDLTPATPLLEQRVSFAERLMWETGVAGIARRLVEMLLPEPGASLNTVLFAYRSRLIRLVRGRIAWRAGGLSAAKEMGV